MKGGNSTATTAKTAERDNEALVQLMDECEKFMGNVSQKRSQIEGEGQSMMQDDSDDNSDVGSED